MAPAMWCRELKLLEFDNFECEHRTPNFFSDRLDVLLLLEKQRYKAVYLLSIYIFEIYFLGLSFEILGLNI